MRQTRKMPATVLVLAVFASVAVVASTMYLLLFQEDETTKKQQLQTEIGAATTLRFDGVVVPASAGAFTTTDAAGTLQQVKLDTSNQRIVIEQSDFNATLLFASAAKEIWLKISQKDNVEYEGNMAGFATFIPQHNDVYDYEITAQFESDGYAGSCRYTFAVRYDAVPSFFLSMDTIVQGDVLLFYGANTRSQDVQVGLDFDYTPYLVYDKSGCKGYIPVSFMRQAGRHQVDVTYGGEMQTLFFTVIEPEYEEQQLTMPESTVSETRNDEAQQEHAEIMGAVQNSFDNTVYWTNPFIQPVLGEITTDYGCKRYTNGATTPSRHGGIDIACAEGTPIVASNTGKVLYSGYLQMTGYTVVIEHGLGLHTIYLHMNSVSCETGDLVERGVEIGTVGMTGYATGPHLHFDVQIGGFSVSPWMLFDETSGVYNLEHPKEPIPAT